MFKDLQIKQPVNILFTSAGRRMELIELFKNNFPKNSSFYGVDYMQTSPTSYILDKVFKVPYKINKIYIDKILKICIDNNINLVIPLIDPELPLLAENINLFRKNNIFVMLSTLDKVNIACDKWLTYKFLKKNNIITPKTILAGCKSIKNLELPIISKPRKGSSGKDITVINNKNELMINNINGDYILQEIIDGDEITVDIFSNGSGTCFDAVQRKRIKIRGGEVERAVTIKNKKIFKIVENFTKCFTPLGVINIQFIIKDKIPYLIEINPRFGGGYPLSYHAGANFPLRIFNFLLNKENDISMGNYTEDLYMLRYDKAVYTNKLIKLC